LIVTTNSPAAGSASELGVRTWRQNLASELGDCAWTEALEKSGGQQADYPNDLLMHQNPPAKTAIVCRAVAWYSHQCILAEKLDKALILLMEATTRIELVYTVLQTVA
jgi:hypothetical protein